MTPIALALIAFGIVAVTLWACNWVSGSGLPKRPTPFICWACGMPHQDTTLCCKHCAPQEVTA